MLRHLNTVRDFGVFGRRGVGSLRRRLNVKSGAVVGADARIDVLAVNDVSAVYRCAVLVGGTSFACVQCAGTVAAARSRRRTEN